MGCGSGKHAAAAQERTVEDKNAYSLSNARNSNGERSLGPYNKGANTQLNRVDPLALDGIVEAPDDDKLHSARSAQYLVNNNEAGANNKKGEAVATSA